MPSQSYETVARIAAKHHGYVTTAQARNQGISADTIRKMATRGNIERVSRGVYRVPNLPASEYSEYMKAVFWPDQETGVVSHRSALSLYGMSDVDPAELHITVPKDYRIRRRQPPEWLQVHHADLAEDEIRRVEGVPVTTPEKTLRDCHAAHLGARLLRQAIEEARREGYLAPGDAERLATELLPNRPSTDR